MELRGNNSTPSVLEYNEFITNSDEPPGKRYSIIDEGENIFIVDRFKKENNIKEVNEFAIQILNQPTYTVEELHFLKNFFAFKIKYKKIEVFFKILSIENNDHIDRIIKNVEVKFAQHKEMLLEVYNLYASIFSIDVTTSNELYYTLANFNTQKLIFFHFLLNKVVDYPHKYAILKPLISKLMNKKSINQEEFKQELEIIKKLNQKDKVKFREGTVVPIIQYDIHEEVSKIQEAVQKLELQPHTELKVHEISNDESREKIRCLCGYSLLDLVEHKERITESKIIKAFEIVLIETFPKITIGIYQTISKEDKEIFNLVCNQFSDLLYELADKVQNGKITASEALMDFTTLLTKKIKKNNVNREKFDKETFRILAGNLIYGERMNHKLPNNSKVKRLVLQYISGSWKEGETRTLEYKKLSSKKLLNLNKTLGELLKINDPLFQVLEKFFNQITPK